MKYELEIDGFRKFEEDASVSASRFINGDADVIILKQGENIIAIRRFGWFTWVDMSNSNIYEQLLKHMSRFMEEFFESYQSNTIKMHNLQTKTMHGLKLDWNKEGDKLVLICIRRREFEMLEFHGDLNK